MYTLGQSSLTLTTDSNCKHSSETIKLETQASPIIFSEELKTMCKHQQDWQDSKPIPILCWPKIENHVLQKTEVERVPLHSLVALVKIESAESQIVTTNLVPSVKEEGIDPIKKFQDQRDNVATNEVLRFEFDQQAFAAFLNGLSGEIGRFIRLTDPKTSKDAIRAAINVIERDRRPQGSVMINARMEITQTCLQKCVVQLNLGTMRWRERRPQHSIWHGEVERKKTSALKMARILDEIGQTKLPRSETEPGAFHRGIPHSPMVRLNQ
uniref:Uncharacterized protein n=1 Tax=Timema bartmani TaxID=61472 RepID=A0A7R9F0X7_9NEOP|nr:unnamed protein product [Timema bartmani]